MTKLLREDKSQKPDFTYLGLMYSVSARIAKRFMEGEKKYARLNWRHAQDVTTYQQSATRHLFQYLDGQTDEDHLVASIVNLMILADLEK